MIIVNQRLGEEPTCLGSRVTFTKFKRGKEGTLRVRVWLESECTVVNNNTYYKYSVEHKPYKHKIYIPADKKLINEQELYECFYNHWQQLNPIRRFVTHTLNGVMTEFSVNELETNLNKNLKWEL